MGVVVSAGKAFIPAPAGVHQAVCCDVVDMGLIETEWKGEKRQRHVVRIVWEIGEINPENGLPFTVHQRYTASLNEKANLRADLESWRGRPFTGDELKAFDLDNVLGKACLLNVIHVEKDGNTYANVKAIMPPPKGSSHIVVSKDYVREKDRKKDPEPQQFSAGDDDVPF